MEGDGEVIDEGIASWAASDLLAPDAQRRSLCVQGRLSVALATWRLSADVSSDVTALFCSVG